MASLYTHIFSYQAALHRTSFHHTLTRVTRPLQRAPILSPLQVRHLSNHVTPSRVVAVIGTGLAGAGLGLSFHMNFQKLNCERESTILRSQYIFTDNRQSLGHLSTTSFKRGIGITRPNDSPSSPTVYSQHV